MLQELAAQQQAHREALEYVAQGMVQEVRQIRFHPAH